jgi:hypothetical protein
MTERMRRNGERENVCRATGLVVQLHICSMRLGLREVKDQVYNG